MKTEEVKYVYAEGPLLVPSSKGKTGNGVYQETTVSSHNNRPVGVIQGDRKNCWSKHLFSRLKLILSCLALVACVVVIIVLLTSGIRASNSREQAQEEEIAKLKDLVDNQQTRLHRMQKELQFLVTRQQAYEAREESLKRRQSQAAAGVVVPHPSAGTGTGSNSWPTPDIKKMEDDVIADPDLPMLPQHDGELMEEEELVDVDKLPRASANKKRKGKFSLDQ